MKACKDCRHSYDLGQPTYSIGQLVCEAPQLRDYLSVRFIDGRRHQNRMTCGDSVRDIEMLCGPDAKWFEVKP